MTTRFLPGQNEGAFERIACRWPAEDLPCTIDRAGIVRHYKRGERIRIQLGAREVWGRIMRGAARLCIAQSLGGRRIVDFVLAGECLENAAYADTFAVEAVCDNTVMVHSGPRSAERPAKSDLSFGEDFRELSLATGARFLRQIMILGRGSAAERVCAFLLDMEARLGEREADRIVLPMSRYDIADYLAISTETVSRCITNLRVHKTIVLSGSREFRILDRAALCGGCPGG